MTTIYNQQEKKNAWTLFGSSLHRKTKYKPFLPSLIFHKFEKRFFGDMETVYLEVNFSKIFDGEEPGLSPWQVRGQPTPLG